MKLSELFLPSNCLLCNCEPQALCDDCRVDLGEHLRAVDRDELSGYCLVDYDQAAVVMHAFKQGGMFAVGKAMAVRLAEVQARPDVDLLVAVPSSRTATKQRGYVPALVVANALGRSWGLPVLQAQLLREGADQAGLSAAARRKNLAGAFALRQPLPGKRVWLVDDIVTTGTTLTELAAACRAAGASVLGFSTLAQTSLKTATKI